MTPVEKLLARVLDDHDVYTPPGYARPRCTCGAEFPDDAAATDHVAHEQGEALRGDEVIERVTEAIYVEPTREVPVDMAQARALARAALAAIFGSSDE